MTGQPPQSRIKATQGRILCVTSNFPRWEGDSTTPFVLHLAQDLQELGWQVDVLAPHAERDTASKEIIGGVQVERFSYLWPQQLQTLCYHGGALINLRRDKSNLLKLPLFVLAEWAAALRRLATRRYDILHSHWILPQGFTGSLASKPLRIPHVLTVHGGDVFGLKGGLLTRFKRFSLHHANAITVNSSVTSRAVETLAPTLNSLHRIPMGVSTDAVNKDDPRVLSLRQRYRRGKGPLLVFVGRVVEEKGIGDLLEAVAQLRETLPDVTALIVGEGQDRPRLQQQAHSLALQDRVNFTGWIDPSEISTYLAAGDLFVGPSRQAKDGWVEAQGLTFIEAMIARTPVIATRSGGITDSVQDGSTGLLVDENSPGQITTAVMRLVNDDQLARTLVDNGYHCAVERFSRAASAQSFSRLFSSMRT